MILIRFKGLSGPPDSQSFSDTPMRGVGSMHHDPTRYNVDPFSLPDADDFGNRKKHREKTKHPIAVNLS